MARKTTILTKNKDIYRSLKMLKFTHTVSLANTQPKQLTRIMKNINRKEKILVLEKDGNDLILKKQRPFSKLNLQVYLG